MIKRVESLARKTVDQIEVDALTKTYLAGVLDHPQCLVERLPSGDGVLHLRRQILHPHAETVEPELRQALQVFKRCNTRVHFDGYFRVVSERESVGNEPKEGFELPRGEVRWGTASPLQLCDAAPVGKETGHHVDLAFQKLEVLLGDVHVIRDDHVTPAKEAAMLAKREVRVQAERRVTALSVCLR